MAKNLMPEVAKLLGVEIGEEFTATNPEENWPGFSNYIFRLTDFGVAYKNKTPLGNEADDWEVKYPYVHRDFNSLIPYLLRGDVEIVKLQKK